MRAGSFPKAPDPVDPEMVQALFNALDTDCDERIGAADVAICVAGMDGALFSALGGLVKCPLVAVPTSVGYGTAFGGISPLLGALNACSAGVGVVNIDNGFGAATLAARIVMGGTRRVDEAVAAEREAAAAAAESA